MKPIFGVLNLFHEYVIRRYWNWWWSVDILLVWWSCTNNHQMQHLLGHGFMQLLHKKLQSPSDPFLQKMQKVPELQVNWETIGISSAQKLHSPLASFQGHVQYVILRKIKAKSSLFDNLATMTITCTISWDHRFVRLPHMKLHLFQFPRNCKTMPDIRANWENIKISSAQSLCSILAPFCAYVTNKLCWER